MEPLATDIRASRKVYDAIQTADYLMSNPQRFWRAHFPSFALASLKLSWISFTLAGLFNIS